MELMVAKVGGSLYDLPDLGDRLPTWVTSTGRDVLLIPGGGAAADVVRRLDDTHRIGAEAAHWLALRVLSVNAHFLAGLVAAPVASSLHPGGSAIRVLDPYAFCQADEGRVGSLPHTWDVTSDAVAARVAEVAQADLMLLKSTDLPSGMSWKAAAAAGLVDDTFRSVVGRARLRVEWVNLRLPDWRPQSPPGGGEPGRH